MCNHLCVLMVILNSSAPSAAWYRSERCLKGLNEQGETNPKPFCYSNIKCAAGLHLPRIQVADASEGRTYDSGASEGRAYDSGASEGRAYDSGASEGRAYDSGASEGRTYDLGASEGRAYDSGASEGRAYDSGASEGRAYDSGASEGRASQTLTMWTPVHTVADMLNINFILLDIYWSISAEMC